jgi:MerR family copper efflux transcriptional regulator
MAAMTIGAVARAAGVGVETIRFYERSGLLAPPPRTAAGYRQYAPDTVQRVIFLRRIQRFGFTLAEASEFLALQEEGAACADGQRLARSKIAALDEQIAHLTATKDALIALVAQCSSECTTDLLGGTDPSCGSRDTVLADLAERKAR